jgi:hypothetical protein
MSEKQSNPHLTFRHLRLPWVSNSATVTVAIRIDKDSETADVAFAFCSPEETGFQKCTGRRIAKTRLDSDRSLSVELLDAEPIEAAVARGIKAALFLRFAAKREYEKNIVDKAKEADISVETARECEPFCHWFPNWFMRAVSADVAQDTDPMDEQKRNERDAQAFVESLLGQCEYAYKVHLAAVKEKHERDAAKKAHEKESAGQ